MSSMTKLAVHFLFGAAVVGAGAATGAALVPEALAQQQPAATNTAAPSRPRGWQGSGMAVRSTSINRDLKAFTERFDARRTGKPAQPMRIGANRCACRADRQLDCLIGAGIAT